MPAHICVLACQNPPQDASQISELGPFKVAIEILTGIQIQIIQLYILNPLLASTNLLAINFGICHSIIETVTKTGDVSGLPKRHLSL